MEPGVSRISKPHGYQIVGDLGSRGRVTVSLAVSAADEEKKVVIKRSSCLLDENINVAIQEGLVQARVEHLNNCRLFELRVQNMSEKGSGCLVELVMEKLETDLAKDIDERIHENRPYSDADLLQVIRCVGEGLAYAREKVLSMQEIAHMDIKPANIFTNTKTNVFKVGDFGCAWTKKGNSLRRTTDGTLEYMSPEVLRSELSDDGEYNVFQADVFSLGVTLVEMATRRKPQKHNSKGKITASVQNLHCEEQLKKLLICMLAFDPSQRPSMADILQVVGPSDAPPEAKRTLPSEILSVSPSLSEDHQPLLPEGVQIDGYEQVQTMTRNSSRVSTAVSTTTGKPVVIKSFTCRRANYANELTSQAVIQARVDHPKICKFIELKLQHVGEKRLDYYAHFVTEKLTLSLESGIEMQGQIQCSEEVLFHFLRDVGEGLLYAQSKVSTTQNIAHLNIKPSNIFFDEDNQVFKIGDFGCTWEKIHHSPESETVRYMSPEVKTVMNNKAAKFDLFAADVFSLGATFMRLATLSLPPTQEQRQDEITSAIRSPSIKYLMRSMLQVVPEKRPTMKEIYNYAKEEFVPFAVEKALPSTVGEITQWVIKYLAERDSMSISVSLKQLQVFGECVERVISAAGKHLLLTLVDLSSEIIPEQLYSDIFGSGDLGQAKRELLALTLIQEDGHNNLSFHPLAQQTVRQCYSEEVSALLTPKAQTLLRLFDYESDSSMNLNLSKSVECVVHQIQGKVFPEIVERSLCIRFLYFCRQRPDYLKTHSELLQNCSTWSNGIALITLEDCLDHELLGLCFSFMGQAEKAEQCMLRVIDFHEQSNMNVELSSSYSNLAMIYRSQGRYGQAKQFALKATDKSTIKQVAGFVKSGGVVEEFKVRSPQDSSAKKYPAWSWLSSLKNSLQVFYAGKVRCCIVRNSPIGEEVIVKQVRCDSEEEAVRVMNEGRIMAASVHPNILECYEVVRETDSDGQLYVFLIMPRMSIDLEKETERRNEVNQNWPEIKLWEIAKDVISALAFLQRKGIAHRDIKPANILIDQNDKVKICDFRFAKDVDLKGLQCHTVLGTIPYFSPLLRGAFMGGGQELHVGHNVFKSDVYSLGITLLHLMLMEFPKAVTDLRGLQRTIDGLLLRASNYSPRFIELVRRMLSVEEDPRPDFLQLDAELNHPQPYADDEVLRQQPPNIDEILQEGLEFTAKCGFNQVRVCATHQEEVPCMMHVKAPSTNPEILERLRTGMDFVCVIDISWRMAGSDIRRVQDTLNKLVQLLKEIDRVSIVAFNDEARRVCPLIACHPLGKEQLFKHITSLRASGGINLIGGFQIGVDIVHQRRYRNQSATILLLSVGQDGTKRDAKAECMASLQKVMQDQTVTIHTLGYGGDIDADLMTALASEGRGILHTVNTEQDVRDAFAMILGSTTSVVARDIEIRLRVNQGPVLCQISKIYVKVLGSDYYYLPEITTNQSKDFIFLLKPAAISLNAKKIFAAVTADIKYLDSEGTEAIRSIDFPIRFVPWEGAPPPVKDASVHVNWNRVLGADYLRNAKNLADQGRFPDAARKLSNALEFLGANGYQDYPIVAAVIQDIEEAQKLVNSDTTWDRGGAAHFASVSYSHCSQSASTEFLQYASPQQQSYRNQFLMLSDISEAE